MNSFKYYKDDVMTMMVKEIVSNLFDTLDFHMTHEKECTRLVNRSVVVDRFNILINVLIVNGKTLTRNDQLLNQFLNRASLLTNYPAVGRDVMFKIRVVFKLLQNIKIGIINENINYRIINKQSVDHIPISVECRLFIENSVKDMKGTRQYVKAPKPNKRFKVDEIIGSRDLQNNWWLSRILYIHDDPNHPELWYYVRYEGWGVVHNEWISSASFRIQKFNPRKHILKRPVHSDASDDIRECEHKKLPHKKTSPIREPDKDPMFDHNLKMDQMEQLKIS